MSVIYPNPTTSHFTIKTIVGTLVRIFAENGKEITSIITKNENTLIDCSLWSKGVYLARITENQSIKDIKIIIR